MKTMKNCLDRVQRRLNDQKEEIWSRQDLQEYAQVAYEDLTSQTAILFDIAMFDNTPQVANHTGSFEELYMTGIITGKFSFTRETERDFAGPSADGPMNCTRQIDASYMDTTAPSPKVWFDLPPETIAVDRVTYNWLRLEPQPARYLRQTRILYEFQLFKPYQYTMDQDGYRRLRLVGIPAAVVPTVTVSGTYGVIKRVTDWSYDLETVVSNNGSYGSVRLLPRHFVSGQSGGHKRVIPDDSACRIELFRIGKVLGPQDAFELPDRAVKYIEWEVMSRAFRQPGAGEDQKLADHFHTRYLAGVQRLRDRLRAEMDERTIAMGGKRDSNRDIYLEHFPAEYGRTRPFRRGA